MFMMELHLFALLRWVLPTKVPPLCSLQEPRAACYSVSSAWRVTWQPTFTATGNPAM